MLPVFEGPLTDDTRVHIQWNPLSGDETGGAAILSYNLEIWTTQGFWQEVIGQTNYYKGTSYLLQTNIVSGQ
jgi:hypothetical protein